MKKFILVLAAIVIAGCSSSKTASSSNNSTSDTSKEKETEIEETVMTLNKDASGNLSGVHNEWAFNQAPYNTWFTPRYEAYNPDEQIVADLKENMNGVTIRAYMGTWCGDSKRETPKFYKLMNSIGMDEQDITMITVDRSKKKPVELVSGYDVIRVPTFIFYRNGSEIGRFVERSRESLEADILKIVSGKPYKHYYDRS